MFGLGKIKAWLKANKEKIIAAATTIATLGNTTTIDIASTVNSMLPMIISLIGVAIPLIFIKYIMRFLEKILSGFG